MLSLLESKHRLLHLRHLLRENQSTSILRWTLDLLSIPNYVIGKRRPHGRRYGKTNEEKEHFIAHNLRRTCIKRGFEGIHDGLQKFPHFVTRNSGLIELKKYASRWTRMRRKISLIACHPTSSFDIRRPGLSLSQHIWPKCTDETPIRLQRSVD